MSAIGDRCHCGEVYFVTCRTPGHGPWCLKCNAGAWNCPKCEPPESFAKAMATTAALFAGLYLLTVLAFCC